ncbi:ABC transporter ATP-binding protein [Arcobacter sp. F2176]|uniref:ABC transporter ATP-binding protein n=1 Tax=Arcobacter sp. F2176 TaxID=2044511 RepID=UPI00100B76B9|nr:dipeptide/oligopeptide/nickel ABC transporter ATP-binding protein [Arcobacter sp. F2176]RXJ81011.1 peptide ABC transporter ATP-binding protein [Arcobacter sp. F2176]
MLQLKNINKSYKKDLILNDINLKINKNSTMGLVGESGSGKTTLAKLILGLENPSNGEIYINNIPLSKWQKINKGKMSIVFQDYRSSINPHFCIEEALQEPLWGKTKLSKDEIKKILKQVELSENILFKYPHELSGGQLQRVCIARALILKPKFLVFDEALSALDVSTQVQIIHLLQKIKEQYELTYLIITHDLELASSLCDEITILKDGNIIEIINSKYLNKVNHSYTKALLDAVIPLKVFSKEIKNDK